MNKPTLALIGPIFSVAGYGKHTRLIAQALLALDKYDLQIIPTKWGDTPQTALNPNEPSHQPILQRLVQGLQSPPDVSIQVSLPTDFQKIGKYSIGVSAMTEANILPEGMLKGSNNADLVIVPSNFSKDVLTQTVIEKRENGTNRLIESLKFNGTCEVLFEGVDTTIYNKSNTTKPIIDELNQIPEDWAYLFVGHWLDGRMGQDRKDVGMLVKMFFETFKGKKKTPALVLKTSGAGFSNVERDRIISKIQEIQEGMDDTKGKLPNVYLLNGELSDSEMNTLYNHPKIKAMVTFTKGEGYCLPLSEFATTGKPILASNYSGHLDFLHPEMTILLPGSLTNIDPSAANEWIPKEGQWFTVNYPMAGQLMKDVFENYPKHLERSRKLPKHIKDNFSLETMTGRLGELLEKYVPQQPKQIKLKLPELKKY